MDVDSILPESIRALPRRGSVVPAYQIVAPGCEILIVTAPAGSQLETHSHPTENATVIVSGEMVLVTDRGERQCGPGDWYQTHPGEQHALRFQTDTVQIELRFSRHSARS